MPDNRRRFIKKFGMTLGALIASGSLPGCGASKTAASSDTQSQAGKPKKPAAKPRAPEWEQLRQCWLKLNNPQYVHGAWTRNWEDPNRDQDPDTATKNMLAQEHVAILNALVAQGQVKEPVAQYMQLAFDQAVFHVVRSLATCYLGAPAEYTPRENLLQQAEVLRKISGDLDPATVAKAQAAITQDMAFFEKLKARPGPDTGWSLANDYKAGALKASPEALEAARLLTELFLEKAD